MHFPVILSEAKDLTNNLKLHGNQRFVPFARSFAVCAAQDDNLDWRLT